MEGESKARAGSSGSNEARRGQLQVPAGLSRNARRKLKRKLKQQGTAGSGRQLSRREKNKALPIDQTSYIIKDGTCSSNVWL